MMIEIKFNKIKSVNNDFVKNISFKRKRLCSIEEIAAKKQAAKETQARKRIEKEAKATEEEAAAKNKELVAKLVKEGQANFELMIELEELEAAKEEAMKEAKEISQIMETNHMTKIMPNMSIDEAQPKNDSCNTFNYEFKKESIEFFKEEESENEESFNENTGHIIDMFEAMASQSNEPQVLKMDKIDTPAKCDTPETIDTPAKIDTPPKTAKNDTPAINKSDDSKDKKKNTAAAARRILKLTKPSSSPRPNTPRNKSQGTSKNAGGSTPSVKRWFSSVENDSKFSNQNKKSKN